MYPAGKIDIRDRIAASASAEGTHSCAEAVERAVTELEREPSLVLFFTAGDVDPDVSAAEAQAAAGGARVAGMTGTGAIGPGRPLKTGCSALALSSSFSTGVGAVDGYDPRTAGRRATAEALAGIGDAPHAAVLLFVDSESGDQAEVVAGAYAVAGGRIPLAGGAAGGPTRARFADGRALSTGVVAVAIGGSSPIGVGVAHSCVPLGAPSIVTRSEGPNIIRLDGRPAETVYLEKIGVEDDHLDDATFEKLAMVHPLAEPELSGGLRPRYVRARAAGGVLVCATSLEENAAVVVCRQTPEAVIHSARTAVEDAVSRLETPPEVAVVFDCAVRSVWFEGPVAEEFAQRELNALAAALGEASPSLAGAYTRGEIGRSRGAKGDRNYSVVVAAFGAPD
ncbi:MAG: FIST signal transduction protein [Gaiellaceae bacterium]